MGMRHLCPSASFASNGEQQSIPKPNTLSQNNVSGKTGDRKRAALTLLFHQQSD